VKVVVIMKAPPKIGSGIATGARTVTVAMTSSVPSGLVHVVDPTTPLKASPAPLQADAKEGRREACPLSAAT
jgi:hypothetical protein